MRRDRHTRSALLGGAIALVFLAACGSTQPSRYYLLSGSSEGSGAGGATGASADPGRPIIGLGPFSWPEYLNRPQIVTRKSDTELHLAEFDRWAEPLPASFLTALVEDVAQRIGSERVVAFPWNGRPEIGCRVRGEVARFDADPGGEAVLIVRWLVSRGPEDPGTTRRSRYQSSATPGDYASLAAALGETVSLFGADVAVACEGS